MPFFSTSSASLLRPSLATLVTAALTGCVTPLVQTPLGTVLIREDPDVVRYDSFTAPDGIEITPFPLFGALVVTRPDGAALARQDRALAEAALIAYCGALPGTFGYRTPTEGADTWMSDPCA